MKRLRDVEPGSPLQQKVRSLLDAAEPLPESRDRMLRVRRALDAPRASGVRRLPALAMALVVALFGASAFAAVRIFEAFERPAAEPAPVHAAEGSDARRRGAARALRPERAPLPAPAQAIASSAEQAGVQPAQVVVPGEQTAVPDAPTAQPRRLGLDRHPGRRTPHAATAPAKPLAQAQPAPQAVPATDSELVHRAVKALRRDRDPALAARLLDEHRARSPRGPLAEEALSLQIEAALALKAPRARVLAREYLSRYPGGRYVAVAQRALEDASP